MELARCLGRDGDAVAVGLVVTSLTKPSGD